MVPGFSLAPTETPPKKGKTMNCRRWGVVIAVWGMVLSMTVPPLHALAPYSLFREDAPQMALMAIATYLGEKIQAGEIDPNNCREELDLLVRREPPEIRRDIELDKALSVKASRGAGGGVVVDMTVWVREKPVRFVFEDKKCEIVPAQLPPLLDRVMVRGNKILPQEIPPGPFKKFLEIVRENRWEGIMVFGGTARNLLLEREYPPGDLDVILKIALTAEEMEEALNAGQTMEEAELKKYSAMRKEIDRYFSQYPRGARDALGVPLQIVDWMDEKMRLHGGFGKMGWTMAELPGIAADRIGIDPESLRLFDPAQGVKDLSQRRLRFYGRDWKNGVQHHHVFRILRLKYQLAEWGMRLDEETADYLETYFTNPPAGFRSIVQRAQKISQIRKTHPDLDGLLKEGTRLQTANDALEYRRKESMSEARRRTVARRHQFVKTRYDAVVDAVAEILAKEQYEEGENPKLLARSLIRHGTVQVDLKRGIVTNDFLGIGGYVLQLYQGVDNPGEITSELRRLGAEPLMSTLGLDLDSFTGYARRIWLEDRIKEMKFDKPSRAGLRMASYQTGSRVIKMPLRVKTSGVIASKDTIVSAMALSHGTAAECLGNLIVPTVVLKNVCVSKGHVHDLEKFLEQIEAADGQDEVELPFVVIQELPEGSMPLDQKVQELAQKQDADGLLRIMRNFVDFHVALWQRGVINHDFRMESYVVDERGNIRLFNLSKISVPRNGQDYQSYWQHLAGTAADFFDARCGRQMGVRFRELAGPRANPL